MKRSKFTDEQILAMSRTHGITEQIVAEQTLDPGRSRRWSQNNGDGLSRATWPYRPRPDLQNTEVFPAEGWGPDPISCRSRCPGGF